MDTRWKQMDVFRHIFKLSNQNLLSKPSVHEVNTTTSKSKTKIGERPSILKQRRSSILKATKSEFPVNQKASKGERLVMNYPALETVKNEKKKLPLTIEPKYNTKKVQELTRETGRPVSEISEVTQDEKEDVEVESLVSAPAPAPEKSLVEKEITTVSNHGQKRLRKKRFNIGDFLKGSLFDLKQLENNESKVNGKKGNKNDASSMTLRSLSTNVLSAPAVSGADLLQLQPKPSSAVVTTKISISRGRMNKIPTFRDDDIPQLPKVMFVQTQELSGMPSQMSLHKQLKRFPIPWKYPHNKVRLSFHLIFFFVNPFFRM